MSWLNDYEQMMFYSDEDFDAICRAANLKDDSMPEILYKYRNASNENHIEALQNDFLIAAAPSELNDPFEGMLHADEEKLWNFHFDELIKQFEKMTNKVFDKTGIALKTPKDYFEAILDFFEIPQKDREVFSVMFPLTLFSFKKMLDRFESDVNDVGNDIYRICSLSASHKSNTMWSHYGDEHKGFCIGYDVKSMNNDIKYCTLPVRYKDSMIEIEEDFLRKKSDLQGMLLLNALSVKSTDWDYENEWRTILAKKTDSSHEKLYYTIPKVLYLGANISDENKEKLIHIAESKGIECYLLVKKKGAFGFEEVKLS